MQGGINMGSGTNFKVALMGMCPVFGYINNMVSAMNSFSGNLTRNFTNTFTATPSLNLTATPSLNVTATPQISTTVAITTAFSPGFGLSSSVSASTGTGSTASAGPAFNGSTSGG